MRHHRNLTPSAASNLATGSPLPGVIAAGSHLSDSEIDDFIIGYLASGPAAHLAQCASCSERVASASSSLTSFQAVSATWSERRSAALPPPSAQAAKVLWHRHLALALPCFVLICGLGILRSTYSRDRSVQPTPASSTLEATTVDVSRQQTGISADDEMLNAISANLDTDSDSPADLGFRLVADPEPPTESPSIRD